MNLILCILCVLRAAACERVQEFNSFELFVHCLFDVAVDFAFVVDEDEVVAFGGVGALVPDDVGCVLLRHVLYVEYVGKLLRF